MTYIIILFDHGIHEVKLLQASINGVRAANKLLKAYKMKMVYDLCSDTGKTKKSIEEHFKMSYGKVDGDVCMLERVNMWGLPLCGATVKAIPLRECTDVENFLKSWDGKSSKEEDVRAFDNFLWNSDWEIFEFREEYE